MLDRTQSVVNCLLCNTDVSGKLPAFTGRQLATLSAIKHNCLVTFFRVITLFYPKDSHPLKTVYQTLKINVPFAWQTLLLVFMTLIMIIFTIR